MNLKDFFAKHKKVALGYSGGVDSSFLLFSALKEKSDVKAYYVKTAFVPSFEYEHAVEFLVKTGCEYSVIECDVLTDEIVLNNELRCYYCKKKMFECITEAALRDGYSTILDGTNASDDIADRPGYKALQEMCVLSPLRDCGLTKDMIRNESRKAGLDFWNRSSYSCLATRIRTGEIISKSKLLTTENAEEYMNSLGFVDFRVRSTGSDALVQIQSSQRELYEKHKEELERVLSKWYTCVKLDKVYRK